MTKQTAKSVNVFLGVLVLALASVLGADEAFSSECPAEKNCRFLGGTVEIFHSPRGQVGYCRLDEALVEEWTLYRVTAQKKHKQATDAFLSHPPVVSDNPRVPLATVYCNQLGGIVETLQNAQLEGLEFCRFDDRSSIGALTLLYGPQHEDMHLLTEILELTNE